MLQLQAGPLALPREGAHTGVGQGHQAFSNPWPKFSTPKAMQLWLCTVPGLNTDIFFKRPMTWTLNVRMRLPSSRVDFPVGQAIIVPCLAALSQLAHTPTHPDLAHPEAGSAVQPF